MKTATGVEKPLAEWTLKEMSEFCKKREIIRNEHSCDNCLLKTICVESPLDWDLEEKPKFTAYEIENAKAVKRILGDGYIRRAMWDFIPQLRLVKTHSYYVFEEDLFPSIKVGEKYKLDEIIGDSDA